MRDISREKIRLAAFVYSGQTAQAWRHPDVSAHDELDLDYYVDYAQVAEAGLFDTLFLADSAAMPKEPASVLETLWSTRQFEPVTLMAALAGRTSHIGLIYTASVSDYEPVLLARQALSLDHLSKGRAGWNIVTSPGPGLHNLSVPEDEDHDTRYARADEFFEVVSRLWDSFETGAFPVDKATGRYADVTKLHRLEHRGRFYQLDAALRSSRSPQGRPVIAQAGSSTVGRDFGARIADTIFCSNLSLADAKAFYADVKARVAAHGRNPDDLKILTGTAVIWAPSRAEAEARFEEISRLHPLDVALRNLRIDFSGYDLDGPVPEVNRNPQSGSTGRAQVITDFARAQGWTIRQTAQRLAASLTHRVVLGTATEIADQLEDWFHARAADGFVLMSPWLIDGLRDFVQHVVPELQRRGLYRTEYESDRLRDNLGVSHPPHFTALQRRASA